MPRLRSLVTMFRALASTLVVTALAASTLVPTHAWAAPDGVLGLEGSDDKAAAALTQALRTELDKRGQGGGPEISLVEFKLTMGCETSDTACLADGGKSLEVDRIIYGSVEPLKGGRFSVSLTLLSISDAAVVNRITQDLGAADLGEESIGATATRLADGLFETGTAVTPPPASAVGGTNTGGQPSAADGPKDGEYVWGAYQPRPAWKKAGLGVSASLAGLGLASGITGAILVGIYQNEKDDAVMQTASDSKPENDVQNFGDVCVEAEKIPNPDTEPNLVKNAPVANACQNGEQAAIIANVGWGVMAVGLVGTIAFTTLMFVHRKEKADSVAAKHDLRFGVMGARDGAMVSTGFKF